MVVQRNRVLASRRAGYRYAETGQKCARILPHRWNVYRAISDEFDLETWTETRHPNKLEAWAQARFERTAYDTLRHFSQSIEETLEMIGNSIFWFLFLRHLSTVTGNLQIRFLPR